MADRQQFSSTVTNLTTNATTNATSAPKVFDLKLRTYYAQIAGTGAVSATVTYQGSIDAITYVTIATLSLTGTTADAKFAEGIAGSYAFPHVRSVISAISGTGATVNTFVLN